MNKDYQWQYHHYAKHKRTGRVFPISSFYVNSDGKKILRIVYPDAGPAMSRGANNFEPAKEEEYEKQQLMKGLK